MVADSPSFSMLWPEFAEFVGDADCLVAHNARFDRGVLHACCVAAGLPRPAQRFDCTVELARIAWKLRPTRLPDCCRYLGIRLNHHDPLSDALACAQIAIAAAEDGQAVRSKSVGEGKSGSVRLDLGGRRLIKQKKKQ